MDPIARGLESLSDEQFNTLDHELVTEQALREREEEVATQHDTEPEETDTFEDQALRVTTHAREMWRDREQHIIPRLRRTDRLLDEDYEATYEPIPTSFPLEIDPCHECPVCQECTNLLSLGCRHIVCDSCIRKLEQKTCPTCREPITMRLVRKRKCEF
jgi:hypothetical protein